MVISLTAMDTMKIKSARKRKLPGLVNFALILASFSVEINKQFLISNCYF